MGIWASVHHWQVNVTDVLICVIVLMAGAIAWGCWGPFRRKDDE